MVGESVEIIGVFVTSVIGDDGNIYTPMGPPNVVMFRALALGLSTIEIFTGDPFHSSQAVEVVIDVK